MQCNTDKYTIRQTMKQKRRLLSTEQIVIKSQYAAQLLFQLDAFKNADCVCVYMSAFGEVDTRAVIEMCLSMNKTVCVPVVEGDNIYAAHYSDECIKGTFGICEPLTKSVADTASIDLFLVPGLAYDRQGGRVGFGKGYYDKLMSGTKAVKIGFAYDFQIVEQIPSEAHDIFMDYVVTDKEIIKATGRNNDDI